jgi:hypothetical protein
VQAKIISHLNYNAMAESNRNRNSQKQTERDNRKGGQEPYKKLPDDARLDPTHSPGTADDPSQGKYSKTGKRDEDVDNDDTRGGR